MKKLNTILLIDDDGNTNILNEFYLKKAKISKEIIKFKDASLALNFLENKKNNVDLVFLDINMPIMNGWEFLKEYEKRNYKSKVIVLSSSINQEDSVKAVSYKSVTAFQNKPLNTNKTLKLLEELDIKTN